MILIYLCLWMGERRRGGVCKVGTILLSLLPTTVGIMW
uniref:Uncharacterized protein n=1 Tax=Anguilla anguilla TaxID=7936 RepID=A0A0E9PAN7_ANGAN